MSRIKKINLIIQEFSIPLISGVILAVIWANWNTETYYSFLKYDLFPGFKFLGHAITFYFIANDIFMVLFFGLATMEITVSFLSGGSLNPISKSINPLIGTVGGILGPVAIFFLLGYSFNLDNLLTNHSLSDILNGWGIPTATDIALAWLVARIIFGKNHPAISFLLLLAIADDAIGLIIIAVFYPSPEYPVEPIYLLINLFAIMAAAALRSNNVRTMWPYLLLAGIPSWLGLLMAHLHPALALVLIIPFLPYKKHERKKHERHHSPPLYQFEHLFRYPVDLGLFFFGIANAGVPFSVVNEVTWIILLSLIVGKTLGISVFCFIAVMMKFPLPDHINSKSIFVIGLIAGLGLTVALFVSGQAYTAPELQGAAKMGALLSVSAAFLAKFFSMVLKIKKIN